MKKLFTIFNSFSDHTLGFGQYEAETPLDALKEYIQTSEALEDYNRKLLEESIMPLLHASKDKGVWMFDFKPELYSTDLIVDSEDNAILGGTIIQTDPEAPTRE